MAEQLFPQFLIALTLFKGISRTVTVSVYIKLSVGKSPRHVVSDERFLVLDGGVVLVQLLVYGYSAVPCYFQLIVHSYLLSVNVIQ